MSFLDSRTWRHSPEFHRFNTQKSSEIRRQQKGRAAPRQESPSPQAHRSWPAAIDKSTCLGHRIMAFSTKISNRNILNMNEHDYDDYYDLYNFTILYIYNMLYIYMIIYDKLLLSGPSRRDPDPLIKPCLWGDQDHITLRPQQQLQPLTFEQSRDPMGSFWDHSYH